MVVLIVRWVSDSSYGLCRVGCRYVACMVGMIREFMQELMSKKFITVFPFFAVILKKTDDFLSKSI